MKNSELIKEFLDNKIIDSLSVLISSENQDEISKAAAVVASQFGSDYEELIKGDTEKFVQSFKKNLTLLIQKTWVEQSDIMLKEEVQVKLEKFCAGITENKWAENFQAFIQILNSVIFLMFGPLSKSPEFEEYSLRIDPEFGIFCWYVSNLPEKNDWSDDKNKSLMTIGMYFLANY